ncbi:proton-conducting transporter transmembrane domain-containing protein [Sulfurospirillum diekertiae]|uniref:proton-conducting transporter transmembrane domain-containing protein n=1 Tax=Sulfurospirillum diekertiae TaxID=1854492 RepID=UPI000B4D2201|nr:proton-conducting transporter membrane subunit [Sulfurospirillum diekertiae]ASC93074.1 Hydrogenase-4 component B [Sulfurospirillum diekertiae]
MTDVYLLYVLGSVVSLLLYKFNALASKIGFGISTIASGYGAYYFFMHIGEKAQFTTNIALLYNPTFSIDPVGNFFSFVITLIAFASSMYAIQYSQGYANKGSLGVMASLFNLFVLSMLMVVSASDVFWFMICWELMTIISAFLICFNDSKSSMKAIMVYLGIAHLGGMCILSAFLLLAHQSGSLEFSSFASIKMSPWLASITFLLAFIGFGSKAGMFPFHVWLPKAHPAAPTNVSALMSGVMIKVALFGIIKFCLWLPVMPWWGLLIIIIGALSSLLGVLYALIQHDYKALLAYHSVENIGIILLGLGTGVYGIAINSPTLATVGFLAGLYHTVNHAIFKGLLFLGAGSVLHATHTREIEALGGLAKKMPYTAFAMFIGVMGIAALPPLNGFVSEWFTYQGMMQGALGEGILPRFIFTFSVVALALTGVLVVIHLKLYAVIFAGTPRHKDIFDQAKEAPISMVLGMMFLVLGCFAFGIGANIVTDNIMTVVTSFSGVYQAAPAGGYIASPIGSTISLPLIAMIISGAMSLPFLIIVIMKANRTKPRETDPWACGFKYSNRMQITAGPFTGDLRRLMEWLFQSKPTVEDQGYFKPVIYTDHPKDIWWNIFYQPVINAVTYAVEKIAVMQNGSTGAYAAYILGGLCLFLAISHLI